MTVKPAAMFFLEFLITGGAAMAWAAWEFWSIRPGKDRAPPPTQDTPAPSEDSPHHDR